MRNIIIIALFISIFAAFLVSCGEDKDKKIKELQHQVQIEKQLKEKEQKGKESAQIDAAESKSSRDLWTNIAIALIFFSGGVAVGSKARKDANNLRGIKKENSDGEKEE